MRRPIFGWSLPPGVTTLPGEEPAPPCDVCGQNVDADDCICPECPVCGTCGDPACYLNHGLRRTEEQKFMLECMQRLWEEQNRIENKYYSQMYEEDNIWDENC